jgi:hypothetical protein
MTTHPITGKVVLLGFTLCAVVDFVLGFFKGRSVLAGIIAVVLGLPLSAVIVYGVLSRTVRKDEGKSDTSR